MCLVYKEDMKEKRAESGVDSLTLLMDKDAFMEKASQWIDEADGNLSLIHMDIENFKSYKTDFIISAPI